MASKTVGRSLGKLALGRWPSVVFLTGLNRGGGEARGEGVGGERGCGEREGGRGAGE